jgi:hypothetical protein
MEEAFLVQRITAMLGLCNLRTAGMAAFIAFRAAAACAAGPRVDLEVATEPGTVLVDAGKWSEMLSQAGFSSVRLRGSQSNEQPALEKQGTTTSPAYRVVGVLTTENKLLLPKGSFGLADRTRIEQWLTKLREGGEESITIKPVAFGLLPRQLVAVHEALTMPVKLSTTGKRPREVAKTIADGLSLKFISDVVSQKALAVDDPVADELQGLSAGTALAAVLRPLGLVLTPEKSGMDVRLRIAESRAVKEHWPVGWPPKGNPHETLPELFKFLNVEITKAPVSEVLAAIGGRVKAPVLIDHNSVVRFEADLTTPVDLPQANTYYAVALDRMLFQAKLKYELRIDEADKPFLWVTTLKK